jgi:subtilase family serine protease
MSPECSWLFLTDFYQDSDIQDALKAANPSCNLDFSIDGSYNTHMYSECACDALNPLSHGDIVSEVIDSSDTSRRLFYPDFPTSSPYVTSVGATAFKTTDGSSVSAEHAASIKDGAIITTGGGFSDVADMPSWQKDAVAQYVAGSTPKPPSATFDATKRGYPDVTLNGHNYQVVYAKDKGESCPCDTGGVDGTSASSPALAGLISLINGHLLAAGKSQLGFLNPFLYAAHAADASLFKDVVDGDNKCTRDYCMQEGFTAGHGWDPVSGLGSINYLKLKEYALSHAGGYRSEIVV